MSMLSQIVVVSFLAGFAAAKAEPAAPCLRAKAALPADHIAQTAEFSPAFCASAKAVRPFRYDRVNRVTRLVRGIDKGEIVSRFPGYGEAVVEPGDTLTLRANSGHVVVERQVVALQEARAGAHVFVQSLDGEILSVLYEPSPP